MLRPDRLQRRRCPARLLPSVLLLVGLAAAAPQPALGDESTLADTWSYWEERPYLDIDPRLLVAVGAPADRVRQDSLIATIRSQRTARPPDGSVRVDEQATLDRMTAEALGIAQESGAAGALPWLAGALLAGGAGLAWVRRRSAARPAARPAATRAPARRARPASTSDAGAPEPERAADTTPKMVVSAAAADPAPSRRKSSGGVLGDPIEALGVAAPSTPSAEDVDAYALDLSLSDEASAPVAGAAQTDSASDLQLDTGFDGDLSAPEETGAPEHAAQGDAEGLHSDAPWLLPDESSARLQALVEPAPAPAAAAAEDDDLLSLGLDDAAPLLPRFTKLEVKEAFLRELRESDLALGFPDGRLAKLSLAKIEAVALVEIAGEGARSLLLDLALDWRALAEGGVLRVVRLRSAATDAQAESLRLLAEELAARSGAPLLSPGPDGAVPHFSDPERYARDVLLVGA